MNDNEINYDKLRYPLKIENVDFRVQQVSPKGYITLLAYKDARVDMQRLDEAVGCLNWKREHTRDNKNCIVSVWGGTERGWVSKEDTGTESFSEKEKGLASSSFKRACSNWGIGLELYDYPIVFFQLYSNEFSTYEVTVNNKKVTKAKTTFDFKLKEWKWELELDINKKVKRLVGHDNQGRPRFDSNKKFNGVQEDKPPTKTPTTTPTVAQQKPPVTQAIKPLPIMVQDSTQWKAMKTLIDAGTLTNITQVEAKYMLTPVTKANILKLIKDYSLKQTKKD